MKKMYSCTRTWMFKTGMVIIIIGLLSCDTINTTSQQGDVTLAKKTVKEVLEENTNTLMSVPGVVGIAEGLTDKKPCIKVFVDKKTPDLDQQIPRTLEGYQVIVEESGGFRALQ